MEDQEDFDQYEINEVEPGCCGHTLDQCEFIRRRPFSDGEWHEELACPTCGELVCGKQIDEETVFSEYIKGEWIYYNPPITRKIRRNSQFHFETRLLVTEQEFDSVNFYSTWVCPRQLQKMKGLQSVSRNIKTSS